MNKLLFSGSFFVNIKQIKESNTKPTNALLMDNHKRNNSKNTFLQSTLENKVKLPTLFNDNSFICPNKDITKRFEEKEGKYSIDKPLSRAKMNFKMQRTSSSSNRIQGTNYTLISKDKDNNNKNILSGSKRYFESIQAFKEEELQKQRNKNAQLKQSRDHVVKTWKYHLEMKHRKKAFKIKLSKYRNNSERMARKIDEYIQRHESVNNWRKERVLLTKKSEMNKLMKKISQRNECFIEDNTNNSQTIDYHKNNNLLSTVKMYGEKRYYYVR